MKKTMLASAAIIIISAVIGIMLYPSMPEQMASHWNIHGEVDGYLPKFWGLFLMPIVSAACLGIFILLPKIDPLKRNIKKFRKFYDIFILVFILFFFYIYLLTILWHLGYRFNMGRMMSPAIGLLFIYLGILTENAKRNWFIGIRTPWTLSDDKVWKKTHALGGKLFKAAGIIALIGFLLPDYAVWLILAPVLITAAWLFIYSYIEYRKIHKK